MYVSILPILIICILFFLVLIKFLIKWMGAEINTDISERKRITDMVENGKISPEEANELLESLGRSSALRGEEKFSRVDIVMLVAVSMVILGFFLPWAYIRLPQISGMFGQGSSAYQVGYHAGPLGWAVFIIAFLSAIPVFVTPKNYLYKISMLQIFLTIIGIILIISILFQVGRNFGIGLIICLLGFILAMIASRIKFKKLAS